jgi:outer membrane protein assembly factor BamB
MTKSKGKERVTCFDATSGKQLWQHSYPCTYRMSYPCGPRATPVVHKGKVYALGAMGDLFCLDAKSGKEIWAKNFVKDYKAPVPVWGFSAHPLIEGDLLICMVGKGPVVVAFDKETGKEKWRALKIRAQVGYCPPMVYTFHKKRHLIIWHPEAIVGLDPKSGKELWSHDWEIQSNLSIPTPRQVGDKLFVTAFYNGCRLLEIGAGDTPEVKVVWESSSNSEQPNRTDKLHSIMSTPYIKGDHIYGVCSYGELRCLTLKDGKRLWADLTATGAGKAPERWANAFLVANGQRFFLFNEKGDLIIAKLTPKGYQQIDKAHILDPTGELPGGRFTEERKIVWSHPAFANKSMFARNDKEIVAVSLAADEK